MQKKLIPAVVCLLGGAFLMYLGYYSALTQGNFLIKSSFLGPLAVCIGIGILILKLPAADTHFIQPGGKLDFKALPASWWTLFIIGCLLGIGYLYFLYQL